jgi:hypothetical protein
VRGVVCEEGEERSETRERRGSARVISMMADERESTGEL